MPFTPKELRTAAAVARESEDPSVSALGDAWDAEAAQLERSTDYAAAIGSIRPSAAPEVRGAEIIAMLLADGWTAPEGRL